MIEVGVMDNQGQASQIVPGFILKMILSLG
jgi:hypothetical protein